jgi:antitoxin CcdA
MKPAYENAALKRCVNLALNADLVDRVRSTTDDISAVVEKLLADYLEQQRQARFERNRISEATSVAWNRFNEAHGSFADEFSSL